MCVELLLSTTNDIISYLLSSYERNETTTGKKFMTGSFSVKSVECKEKKDTVSAQWYSLYDAENHLQDGKAGSLHASKAQ
jgi:hypothetical protein